MKIYYMDIGEMDDGHFDRWKNEVSEYRRKKAEALRFENDRKLSLAAGRMLAAALAEVGIDETTCTYETTEHGNHRLKEYPTLAFNISHSGQIAVAAVCPPDKTASCGVDVEPQRSARMNVAKRFFSELAYKRLQELSAPEADAYFARIWTRMEAYGKCLGKGLDFTDALQKNVMDDVRMKNAGYYFHEYQIADHEGHPYQITVCTTDPAQAESAELSMWEKSTGDMTERGTTT